MVKFSRLTYRPRVLNFPIIVFMSGEVFLDWPRVLGWTTVLDRHTLINSSRVLYFLTNEFLLLEGFQDWPIIPGWATVVYWPNFPFSFNMQPDFVLGQSLLQSSYLGAQSFYLVCTFYMLFQVICRFFSVVTFSTFVES